MLKLLKNKWYPPAPCTELFTGKTILITGASGGLGLEAAKKLAALDTRKLIITARTTERGEEAKKQIKNWLDTSKISTSTEIHVLPLSMSSAEEVKEFIPKLKAEAETLDAVILNAGVVQSTFELSPDGYEKTIQINTLSTTLLAMCLLPILVSSSESLQRTTRLVFVSSGTATRVSLQSLEPFFSEEHPIQAMSKPEHFPEGIVGAQGKYAQSKILLEYAMRRMAALPVVQDGSGEPKVIINSVCPGMCKSDLGRNFTGPVTAAVSWIIFTFFARTAEQGTNSYMTALTRDKDGIGQLWRHDVYEDEWEAIASEEGRKFGDKVWKEICGIIRGWEPGVGALI